VLLIFVHENFIFVQQHLGFILMTKAFLEMSLRLRPF
jgi:hypothetical protein